MEQTRSIGRQRKPEKEEQNRRELPGSWEKLELAPNQNRKGSREMKRNRAKEQIRREDMSWWEPNGESRRRICSSIK